MATTSNPLPILIRVSRVAKELDVQPAYVLALVADGQLEAVDIRRPGALRPTWRITRRSFEAFTHGSSCTDELAPGAVA